MRSAKQALFLAFTLVLTALALSAAPGVASAATTCTSGAFAAHEACQFGEEGEGAGQFDEPRAVAVDNSGSLLDESAGDVYVADDENRRVDKFSGEGVFLLAWGWGVANGEEKLETCGPDSAHAECLRGLKGEGSGPFAEGSGQFAEPSGIAVDDSSGFSQGDVYVQDVRYHRVQKFKFNPVSKEEEFVLMFGGEVNKTKDETPGATAEERDLCKLGEACKEGVKELGAVHGGFESQQPNAIAVDSTGTVYVGDKERVQEFTEGGAFTSEIPLVGAGNIEGLLVDNTIPRHLYVGGEESPPGVHEYELPSGTEVKPVRDESGRQGATAVGPNNELFVEDRALARILEFDPAGVEVASVPRHTTSGAEGLAYGTVDGRLQLYVVGGNTAHVVPGPLPGPLVEGERDTVEPVGTVTVTASIDPEGEQTKYEVQYGVEGAAETTTAPVTMTAEGFKPEEVQVALKGLLPDTTYDYHFVAKNTAGTSVGSVESFTTLPAVSIDSESASQVTSTSARLEASLNPFTQPTHYRFQYGRTTAYEEPAVEGYAGSGLGDVSFSVLAEHLSAGTVYHYRVVATNECEPLVHPGVLCTVEGADRTFTTQSGEGPGLIDGRGWEMVSPPDKHGAALEAINLEGGDIQAAQDGGGLAYIAKAPVTGEPAGNRSYAIQQLLATRNPAGAWSTREIATPHEAVAATGPEGLSEYRLFSPDLSTAVVEPSGATPLSAPQSEAEQGHQERTPYARDNSACEATSSEAIPAGCYTPLVTRADDTAEPFEPFGDSEAQGKLRQGTGVEFVTATADLTHLLVQAPQSLVKGFQAGGGTAGGSSLYEWGQDTGAVHTLQPVSLIPALGADSCGGTGPACVSAVTESETGFGATVGDKGGSMRNAVSADGGRVFFQIQPNTSEVRLFLRDMARKETVRVDAAQPGLKQPEGEAAHSTFMMANTSGSRVFFTSPGRLTADSTASEVRKLPDLYVFEVTSGPSEPLKGTLTDLTVEGDPLQSAAVGGVIGASEDGSQVYFDASGAPLNGAPEGNDIYVESYDQTTKAWSAPRYIATLAGADGQGLETGNLKNMAARVSPNGRFLAFMSQASLTGYDNIDTNPGAYEVNQNTETVYKEGRPVPAHDEEVYEYDADSGKLACASCDPSGARPAGVFDGDNEVPSTAVPVLLVDRTETWVGRPSRWLAGSIPGWTPTEYVALYQSRYLTNEGRLFFNSPADLVPAAGNGREDVYEFEPEGLGGCSSSTSTASSIFKPGRNFEVSGIPGEEPAGCVGLISSGTSAEESAFLDASGMGPGGTEGEDVFFLTAAKLSSADTDTALDVYDAHVCSSASPCPAGTVTVPPACSDAESCRESPAPQPGIYGPPPSATFTGPGNVTPEAAIKPKVKTAAEVKAEKLAKALRTCAKDKKKSKRAKCQKTARSRYGTTKKVKKKG